MKRYKNVAATPKRKLTPKQAAFVREYLVDMNAAAAYQRAGYKGRGAKESASRLLTNANVSVALKAAMDARAKRTEITGDKVLYDLRFVADVCLGRESVINKKKWKDEDGIEREEEAEVTRFNPGSAIKALETIGKHLGMFKDDDDKQDINALFVSGVRALIQSEPILPRDRDQLRLEDQNEDHN